MKKKKKCKADYNNFQGRLSILEPLGDVDYYPNGGQHQPGCTDACFGIFCLEIDLWDFFNGM